jgi:hypothetical protein
MKTSLKKHKYNAEKTKYNGVTFDSKKEAKYAAHLDLLIKVGEVIQYQRQVRFTYNLFAQQAEGGKIVKVGKTRAYIVDFVVYYSSGVIEFIDVKGYQTKAFKEKEKIVQTLFNINIKKI